MEDCKWDHLAEFVFVELDENSGHADIRGIDENVERERVVRRDFGWRQEARKLERRKGSILRRSPIQIQAPRCAGHEIGERRSSRGTVREPASDKAERSQQRLEAFNVLGNANGKERIHACRVQGLTFF